MKLHHTAQRVDIVYASYLAAAAAAAGAALGEGGRLAYSCC